MKILIVVPPAGTPTFPSLGAEILAQMARSLGHECDVLHGPLKLPRYLANDYSQSIVSALPSAAAYYNDDLDTAPQAMVASARQFTIETSLTSLPCLGERIETTEYFYFATLEAIRVARIIADEIVQSAPDLVAFSIAFDNMKLPAAAVARELRNRGFSSTIVAGGSALEDAMGPAFLQTFPEFDYVLSGEAEHSWPDLCRLLSNYSPVNNIPGLVLRTEDGVEEFPPRVGSDFVYCRHAPVDWSQFLEQKRMSEWVDDPTHLFVEGSRGCWWADKHRCLFCSTAQRNGFRARSIDQIMEHVESTISQAPDSNIVFTDCINPHAGLDEWLHRLASRSPEHEGTLFSEVKSTYGRRIIAQMSLAGITRTQPGIENFSTNTLKLMRKGARALQQVNFLKWARAYGMEPVYSILVGSAGEDVSDIARNKYVLSKIPHLKQAEVHTVFLMRGSPYEEEPELYGINDIEAPSIVHYLYRSPFAAQNSHTLRYRCNRRDEPAYRDEVQALAAFAHAQANEEETSLTRTRIGAISIVVRKQGEDTSIQIANPTSTTLLDLCEEPRSLQRCAKLLNLSIDATRALADELEKQGWLLRDGDHALTLTIPSEANALVDAGWNEPAAIHRGGETFYA